MNGRISRVMDAMFAVHKSRRDDFIFTHVAAVMDRRGEIVATAVNSVGDHAEIAVLKKLFNRRHIFQFEGSKKAEQKHFDGCA